MHATGFFIGSMKIGEKLGVTLIEEEANTFYETKKKTQHLHDILDQLFFTINQVIMQDLD